MVVGADHRVLDDGAPVDGGDRFVAASVAKLERVMSWASADRQMATVRLDRFRAVDTDALLIEGYKLDGLHKTGG